jgi:serine/threonine protein kinase
MKNSPEFCPDSFSLHAEQATHEVCHRYERALQGGRAFSIADLLEEIDLAARPLALYELVKLDGEFRQNRGERPTPADYAFPIECPNAGSAVRAALQSLEEQLSGGAIAGESVPPGKGPPENCASGAPSSPITFPRDLGRYSITERLGQGGMGTVFKAFDQRLERFVALKIPHFDDLKDGSVRARFRREALALAALNHETIVAVYDVERSGDYEFMTMALIEGATLRRYIRKERPLAEHHAAILIRALAKAMQYVHDSGVIHRDLKPENVIIEDGRKPVIVDFGLARSPGALELTSAPAPAGLGRHVTRFGHVAGTPDYCSPEQLAGDFDAIGPQTDIYSLGVILFELLTGQLPWDTGEKTNPADATSSPPLELQACELNPRVDRRLSDVCATAMQPDQTHRYRSMTEFADALKPFCQPTTQPPHAGQQTLNDHTDSELDAILKEIGRQATRKHSRPAGRSRSRKYPVATLAMFPLVALASGALLLAMRDSKNQSSKSAQAPQLVPQAQSALPPPSPLGAPNSAAPSQPETPPRQRVTSDRRPDPVDSARSASLPPPKTAGPAKKDAAATLLPKWHPATVRIIEGGGKVLFRMPTNQEDWQRKWVTRTADIPTRPESRVQSIVLERPDKGGDYAGALRQIFESIPQSIRILKLTGVPLDEPAVAAIARLPKLQRLVLRDVGISGSLWEVLSRGHCESLREIDLGESQIDSASLDLLLTGWEQSAAPLESVGLSGAQAIGKRQFERIARFPKLVKLDLADAGIEPAAIAQLADASHLASLNLAGVQLPEGSARFLTELRGLEHLDLSRTPISDDSLSDFVKVAKNLDRLKSINVEETRFTSAGILSLADLLGKHAVAVRISAGSRLDFGYRSGLRREKALQHFQADTRVKLAISAGIDWLLRNQRADGLWSLVGPYPDGAAKENRLEASALALLALQGHGYDGLDKDEYHHAVRRGYQGLGLLVQNSQGPSELGSYGNAMAALAVCDLHAMAGYQLQQNSHLPQREIVEGILQRCRDLQRDDGGWGGKDRGESLLTGWYVQALTSANAAGFQVDQQVLDRATKFLQELWRSDGKRYIYQNGNRQKFVLASHAAATTSLHALHRTPNTRAANLFTQRYQEAASNPYFSYYGTRSAIDMGDAVWTLWNRGHVTENLCDKQVATGPQQGSWHPSTVSDDQGVVCRLACGRFYATCLNILALESFYRHLPLSAPAAFRMIETRPSE